MQALRDAGELDPGVDVDRAATAVRIAGTGGATRLVATGRIHHLGTAPGEALDRLHPGAVTCDVRRCVRPEARVSLVG